MFQFFLKAFRSEIEEIKQSYYKLFLLTLFPFVSFALVAAIFYKGVAYEMPVAVVDYDKSQLSRKLLFNIDASPTVKIVDQTQDLKSALKLLQSSKVYGIVVIKKDFFKDTLTHKQPKVTALLNTQYILIGKILKAALLESVGVSAAEVEFVGNLKELENIEYAKKGLNPINLQVTPFFNTYKNYFYFLVSALFPAIWQIFIVIATIVSFGSMFKEKKEREFFQGGYVGVKILGKMFPYTIAYIFWGIAFLSYLYINLPWEFHGSIALMLEGVILTTFAYQAIALLLFVTGFDYTRTLSLGAVYTAPAFAFLGVTFPIYSMNAFALFWRDMLPVSYFMELQISQANYGASALMESDKLLHIGYFILAFIPVIFMFKKRLADELF